MILTKLLEFQKANVTLKKNGINPHFKSSYVTLNEVLDKVKEPLNALGVLVVQEPSLEGLRTRLIDTEDSTEVEGLMPWVGHDNAQKLLACTTYYRRGSLVAMLGLEDEDDDGEVASKPAKSSVKATSVTERNDEPFPPKATFVARNDEMQELDEITWN